MEWNWKNESHITWSDSICCLHVTVKRCTNLIWNQTNRNVTDADTRKGYELFIKFGVDLFREDKNEASWKSRKRSRSEISRDVIHDATSQERNSFLRREEIKKSHPLCNFHLPGHSIYFSRRHPRMRLMQLSLARFLHSTRSAVQSGRER